MIKIFYFYLNLFSFRHPGDILLEFPVHYNLLWYGFPTLFLSQISMFLAGLSTPIPSRIFSIIVSIHGWLAFLRMLNGVSSSWMGAFLRFLCLPGLEFCQSSNFHGLVVSFLGCSLNCGGGFKYCTKTLGLLIST